jgi:hypothetical protein
MGDTNLKGMYFDKDMGDGTSMKIIRLRRPDDEVWALALQLRCGPKTATCFLEDVKGVPFVQELADALVDYLYDLSEIEIEQMEQDGEAFTVRKEEEAKKNKDKVEA